MASTPGRDPHRRIAGMQHAALIAAIMAAVTFAIMFLFDLPWLGVRPNRGPSDEVRTKQA